MTSGIPQVNSRTFVLHCRFAAAYLGQRGVERGAQALSQNGWLARAGRQGMPELAADGR